ncbi:MAG: DUF481 domain-containing protein [Longimonas sp.]|uniref:DUF481 domain-containing protein n=1 Tax=Longimonas sp. TaxID=2039626 RepID=UPI00397673CF
MPDPTWYPWGFVASILLAGILLAHPADAQVNTERMRKLEVDGIGGAVGGSLAIQSGNTELIEVGGDARLDVLHAPHYAFIVSEVRYGESDGSRFRDAAFAHLRYNYRFGGPLVAEAFTQLERDSFALLNLRTLVGGGLRLRVLDTEPARLFLGTTPMFERERLDTERVGAHPDRTTALRISQYLNVRLRLSDRTFLVSTTYVQPWVAVPADVRLLNETRLGVGITEALTLRITLKTRYDSRPPGEVSDWTLSWTNGITFTW